jgi:hypothetical protein
MCQAKVLCFLEHSVNKYVLDTLMYFDNILTG